MRLDNKKGGVRGVYMDGPLQNYLDGRVASRKPKGNFSAEVIHLIELGIAASDGDRSINILKKQRAAAQKPATKK